MTKKAKEQGHRIHITLSNEVWFMLESWRRSQDAIPPSATAVKDLMVESLMRWNGEKSTHSRDREDDEGRCGVAN